MQFAKWMDRIMKVGSLILLGLPFAASAQTTTNVLAQAPQFGIYQGSMPANYYPPSGVVVLRGSNTWYTLTKLSATQKQQLGADLSARVTKTAGCDAFDRIESVVYLTETTGVQPTTSDLTRSVEMVRFMTSFSTYNNDSSPSPYVFPLMDISNYATLLADTTQDIWVGFAGGSNPNYPNASGTYNPCWDSNGNQVANLPTAPWPTGLTTAQSQTIYAYTGFNFALDFLSTQPPSSGTAPGSAVVAALNAPTVPTSGPTLSIAGTVNVPAPAGGGSTVIGTVHVIITSHGSDSEYGFNSGNVLKVNGTQVGSSFSMQADCNSFASASINPLNSSINSGTTGSSPSNPRNWCPAGPVRTTAANPSTPNPTSTNLGTPVQAQIFSNVTLNVGSNTVELDLGSFTTAFGGAYNANNGDYYPTSIVFVPGATSSGTPGAYNVNAIYTDGTTFSSGGIDGAGYAYSSNLLGSSLTWNSSSFTFGPANSADAWSSTTIPLTAGQFGTLKLLGAAVNGNQTSQTFTVNYTDGTSTNFSQSLSDWFSPQSYTGESTAATMAYRDASGGTKDNHTFYLYGYSFAINSAKTVKSVTLPNNRNVVVLAYALAGAPASATQVNLSSSFNRTGIYTDGTTFSATGGLDGVGYAYSSQLLGTSLTFNSTPFNFGAANAANDISAAGQTVTLPAGKFSSLRLLASAVNGSQASQTFKVNFTDGTSSSYIQSISDWFAPQNYSGESKASTMAYRDTNSGGKDNRTFYLYYYTFTLNNTKTVQSVQLPSNANVQVLALTLVP